MDSWHWQSEVDNLQRDGLRGRAMGVCCLPGACCRRRVHQLSSSVAGALPAILGTLSDSGTRLAAEFGSNGPSPESGAAPHSGLFPGYPQGLEIARS
jgi:hypothetical protein